MSHHTPTLWGIHMGAQIGTDPIEQGYIGIGWADELGDLSHLPDDREEFKKVLREAQPDATEASIRTQVASIYRFVHAIQRGDWVVYPCKENRRIYIGEIIGGYEFRDGLSDDDYPNRRHVQWLTPDGIERNIFSQEALYEIGAFMTLFEIKVNTAEFLNKINRKDLGSTLTNKAEEVEIADSPMNNVTNQQIANVAAESTVDFVIRQLHTKLTGYEFELFIAHLLNCMGYTAYATQKSGDGGVDVIAHKDAFGFEPPVIKVQCKRSLSSNGTAEINQLLGTLGDGEYGLFVNLGSYSRDARAIERSKSKLTLIDGQAVVDLIFKHYEQLAHSYRVLLPLKQIFVPDLE